MNQTHYLRLQVLVKMVSVVSVRGLLFVCLITFAAARSSHFLLETLVTAVGRGYPLLTKPQPGTSAIQCGMQCMASPFCAMFLHSKTLEQCVLYGITNSTASSYTFNADVSWKPYAYKPDCRFMYVKALNKCWTITSNTETMSAARSRCQNLGGDLVQFKSMEEFQFLKGVLLSTQTWSSRDYWIGASKSSSGFTWLGTSQVVDVRMWETGQPDNYGSHNEDCVNIMSNFSFNFNDVDCGVTIPAVCSVP